MSEKRFEITEYGSNYYIEIIDNEKELDESIHNPSQKLGLVECADLLNDLVEENDKLRFLIDINSVSERTKLERQVDEQQFTINELQKKIRVLEKKCRVIRGLENERNCKVKQGESVNLSDYLEVDERKNIKKIKIVDFIDDLIHERTKEIDNDE